MSKKRRRAASRPKRPAASTPRPESKPQAAEPPAPVRGRAARTRDRSGASSSRAADRARAVADIPKQPPLLPSLARGLFAVGTSPSLLVTAFLGVLMMWAIYAGLGIAGLTPPGLMAQLEAVPPLHSGIDANMFQV